MTPADRSPVLLLQDSLARSVYTIAPERKAAMLGVVKTHNIELVISDDRGFSIRADPSTGDITVPIAAMEYVWACSHAFMVFYDEYGAAQRRADHQFDLMQAPRARDAADLFNWAINNMENSGVGRWPTGLPKPEDSPPPKSDVQVANEAYLCAMSWILHHEVAHIRLQHPPKVLSNALQEEKAADREATAWILDAERDVLRRRKRILGIVVATLAIQAHESIAGAAKNARSHPEPHQRLADCLYQYPMDENDEVLAVAAANLQILLAQKGLVMAQLDQDSFDALVSEFLVAFSRT